MSSPTASETDRVNRRRATLAVLPFLVLGISDVVLILGMGLKPIWGLLILPPILFVVIVAWIGFKTGFTRD